jgi:hypothetical protein
MVACATLIYSELSEALQRVELQSRQRTPRRHVDHRSAKLGNGFA